MCIIWLSKISRTSSGLDPSTISVIAFLRKSVNESAVINTAKSAPPKVTIKEGKCMRFKTALIPPLVTIPNIIAIKQNKNPVKVALYGLSKMEKGHKLYKNQSKSNVL